ncbi:MAG TPA: alpha/beta family hydrolase [Gemmatimonadaceae bacterium]|jgi:predicted alpha/beta-hydrolase family hydrolase|nr:alpha/beta family hydrolase [Gemmatimonadaceae bacterium]
MSVSWRVAVDGAETSALYEPAEGNQRAVFVAAHGAGGSMMDRGMASVTATLRRRGLGIVRFNFLYKERKSGRPDPMPTLMKTFASVVDRVRAELGSGVGRLVIGGRSMGGRAGSMLAADGFAADGLLLLAYPLHPAGKPDQLRDAHLPRITMPVLCFNGTRDALCTPDIMRRVLTTVHAPWEMHWLEGADHSFHVLKSSGRTDAEVLAEVGDVSDRWLARLS